jgi:Bacterial Ig-like domain
MQGVHRGRAGAFACALGLIVWSCSWNSRDFRAGSPSGGAGEGGEPPIVGTGGTDAKLDGGAGAETAGGTVAEAGGGSQSQGLSVVSTSPKDAATGTERNAAVEVTFSAPIDETSIAAESFQVTGPSGPVDGELSVDGATVTFTPGAPWALLADYVIDVAASVASVDAGELGPTSAEDFGPAAEVDPSGNALAAWPDGTDIKWRRSAHSAPDWTEPLQIKDQDPYLVVSASDASGDVVLVWTNPLGVWATRFE